MCQAEPLKRYGLRCCGGSAHGWGMMESPKGDYVKYNDVGRRLRSLVRHDIVSSEGGCGYNCSARLEEFPEGDLVYFDDVLRLLGEVGDRDG